MDDLAAAIEVWEGTAYAAILSLIDLAPRQSQEMVRAVIDLETIARGRWPGFRPEPLHALCLELAADSPDGRKLIVAHQLAWAEVERLRAAIEGRAVEHREFSPPPLGVRRREMVEFLEHLGETVGPRDKLFERLERAHRIEARRESRTCWRVRFTDPEEHRIFAEWHRLNVAGRAKFSKVQQS